MWGGGKERKRNIKEGWGETGSEKQGKKDKKKKGSRKTKESLISDLPWSGTA